MSKVIKLKLKVPTGVGAGGYLIDKYWPAGKAKGVLLDSTSDTRTVLVRTNLKPRMEAVLLLGYNCAYINHRWLVGGDLKALKHHQPRVYDDLKARGLLFKSSRGARK